VGIVSRRLRNQRLVGPALSGPHEVVRHLGALQAQDVSGAKWAIAQRCGCPTNTEVEGVIASGAILRTHVLRPTWHFIAPEDIRWTLRLTAPRVMARLAARHRELELKPITFSRCRTALETALAGGVTLTRAEACAVVAASGTRLDGARLTHILLEAELGGIICSGPPRGGKQTYALLEDVVRAAPEMEPDEALEELAVRYFTGHGPARLVDFTWWSSLTAAQARRGIEVAGDRLATEKVAERQVWFSPVERVSRVSSPLVRLLPNYDEYVVAYRERSEFYDRTLDPMTVRGGVMANVVIVDGWAVGTWRRRPAARRIDLIVRPWTAWSPEVWDALSVEGRKLERHLELPVTLVLDSS